jgi:hypothetical protein
MRSVSSREMLKREQHAQNFEYLKNVVLKVRKAKMWQYRTYMKNFQKIIEVLILFFFSSS